MDVSIILVNYKTKDLTIDAIKSVIEKTQVIKYEIFVVDNNSQDGSIEAIEKEFPNINIIKNITNAGFGAANNLAIRQAKGKYIFCLNTDTLLVNNAIKIMFDYMEEHPNTGACGGNLTDVNNIPLGCAGVNPNIKMILCKIVKKILKKDLYKIIFSIDDIEKGSKFGFICGADIFFRKTVLDKVGIFDENIFMYNEEADLCKRVVDAGFDLILLKDAKIIHLEGQTTKLSTQKKEWAKNSEMYYFKKHYPFKYWIARLIYIILYLFDWLILGHKESKILLKIVLNG